MIFTVTALVLYWVVRLFWDFLRPWDYARSPEAPNEADRRSGPEPQQNAPEQLIPPRHRRPF
jgi:hypothetical protein